MSFEIELKPSGPPQFRDITRLFRAFLAAKWDGVTSARPGQIIWRVLIVLGMASAFALLSWALGTLEGDLKEGMKISAPIGAVLWAMYAGYSQGQRAEKHREEDRARQASDRAQYRLAAEQLATRAYRLIELVEIGLKNKHGPNDFFNEIYQRSDYELVAASLKQISLRDLPDAVVFSGLETLHLFISRTSQIVDEARGYVVANEALPIKFLAKLERYIDTARSAVEKVLGKAMEPKVQRPPSR